MMRRLTTPEDEYRHHPEDRCLSGVPVDEEIASFETYLMNRYPLGHAAHPPQLTPETSFAVRKRR